MRRFTRAFYVALGAAWLVPVFAYAAGLVPCGGIGQAATGCQACDLAQLIQNIINYAIGISIPLFVLLLAWVGVLYFTAAANPKNVDKAKKILKAAFIGFLVTLSAWLVINTLLHTILNQNQYTNGSWFTIQCVNTANGFARSGGPQTFSVSQLLSTLPVFSGNASWGSSSSGVQATQIYACGSGASLQTTSVDPSSPSGTFVRCQNTDGTVSMPTCNGGYQLDATTGQCVNANTGIAVDPNAAPAPVIGGARGIAQCSNDNPNCSIANLEAQGLNASQAAVMSCIAITENAGQAVGCSGTGPCGTFQISQTNWQAYAPSTCSASNFGGSITAAQNNGQCNLQTASAMVQKLGFQPWTGSNNGVAWNTAASTCANNYGQIGS